MLSILKYSNKRQIDSSYIIFYAISILFLSYLFGVKNISFLLVIDIYLFLYMTFFKFNTYSKAKSSFVKIDITKEGVEKEEFNIQSLISDYSKKFSNK